MTVKTQFEIDQPVIFYDPNHCRILPGHIAGVNYFQLGTDPAKESYYIKPLEVPFNVGPIPVDFIFKDKDSVLDFCCKLMKDIEEI